MADTTLLLNGFSIIGDPHTNSNASGGGELMIHDGEAVFSSGAIVAFHVENANPDGSLNGNSVITGVTVYANASDYYLDVPQYTYSGSADIDTGRNNMGDRYLEFDASGLTSTDSGAPVLDDIALVAGVDVLAAINGQSGPYEVPTNEDIDLNGDGQITGSENSDGVFSSDLNVLATICFARGTMIDTPQGPRLIETLQPGDPVHTLDAGPQVIRWIGGVNTPAQGVNAPVHIKAGALGNVRDLRVSQNHRMLITGARADLLFGQPEVLVPAKFLVNDSTIRIVPEETITYYHFLFDAHHIVFAEACPAESLFPGKQTLDALEPHERDEILNLFPNLDSATCQGPLSRYALKSHEVRALMLSA